MDLIGKLHEWTFDMPEKYGPFHLIFLMLTFFVAALLIIFFKDCRERTMKRIVLIAWIILVLFEIIKAIIMSYQYDHLEFPWGSFPFQFCETPLYAFPILLFNKNKKIQHAIITFLCTYVFFAGFALMVNPYRLFSIRVILSVRTMVQHGIQVVIGLFLFAWDRHNINFKTFVHGTIVFAIFTTIAMIINFTLGRAVMDKYEVNMFWISKDYDTPLMILKRIKPIAPYYVFIISYFLGFGFCAGCSLLVEYIFFEIIQWIHNAREIRMSY